MKKLKLKKLPQTWIWTCLDLWFLCPHQSIMESYVLVFSHHHLNTLGVCVCVCVCVWREKEDEFSTVNMYSMQYEVLCLHYFIQYSQKSYEMSYSPLFYWWRNWDSESQSQNSNPYHSEFKVHDLSSYIVQPPNNEEMLFYPMSIPVDPHGDVMRLYMWTLAVNSKYPCKVA